MVLQRLGDKHLAIIRGQLRITTLKLLVLAAMRSTLDLDIGGADASIHDVDIGRVIKGYCEDIAHERKREDAGSTLTTADGPSSFARPPMTGRPSRVLSSGTTIASST